VDRIGFMLSDSGAAFGLTMSEIAPAVDFRWLTLDSDHIADRCAGMATDALDVDVAPDVAAYMIYTSGSTGTPKGVVVTHRGLNAFTAEYRTELGLTAHSRTQR